MQMLCLSGRVPSAHKARRCTRCGGTYYERLMGVIHCAAFVHPVLPPRSSGHCPYCIFGRVKYRLHDLRYIDGVTHQEILDEESGHGEPEHTST